jgi:hypothetical protein
MMIFLPILVSFLFLWYSYGFVDIAFSRVNPMLYALGLPVSRFLYDDRVSASILFIVFFVLAYLFYGFMLRYAKVSTAKKNMLLLILGIGVILLFSFPLFSYDIFNYVLTGKVLYFYRENPYITMPIEFASEPMLAFTRAANKVALYGPVWLGISSIPHILSMGSTWAALFWFKFIEFVAYMVILITMWKKTHSLYRVAFFAFNPLVLSEILVNGHNDAVMMALALCGIYFIESSYLLRKISGYALLFASVFIKGATLVLLPAVLSSRMYPKSRYILYAACMFMVFLLTPVREEMYPWYAVWFMVFLPLIDGKIGDELRFFGILFSAGLLLRHLPYVMTREYGGVGPMLRIIFTWAPLVFGLSYRFIHQYFFAHDKK